jgi:hypothetical protein
VESIRKRLDRSVKEQMMAKEAEVPFVLVVTGGENLNTHEETKLISA